MKVKTYVGNRLFIVRICVFRRRCPEYATRTPPQSDWPIYFRDSRQLPNGLHADKALRSERHSHYRIKKAIQMLALFFYYRGAI
jgi:hypothetical protein